MRSQRITEIEQYIYTHKTASFSDLCNIFHVSKNTIRRDMASILQNPDIVKTYGGVMLSTQTHKSLISFMERSLRHQPEKQRIAALAATLVNDGENIFIDSGTTTACMIDYLKDKKITLVTANIQVIQQALPHENIEVISFPVSLTEKPILLQGFRLHSSCPRFNITKAFLAATGLTLKNGATNSSAEETCIKEIAVKKSEKSYLLVDSDKFGGVSLRTFSNVNDFTGIITDKNPDDAFLQYSKEHQVDILLPPYPL